MSYRIEYLDKQEPEVVEADDVSTRGDFVELRGSEFRVVKFIPVNRVKAITRI